MRDGFLYNAGIAAYHWKDVCAMPKIFIVEDDDALSEECRRLLELSDYEVATCENFTHAVEEASDAGADCVILDLKLPETDGLSVCRAIRAKSEVPIIVLTSSDSEFDEVMSMNLGADDYLTKPYSPAVLLAHVSAALRRANPQLSQAVEYGGVSLDAVRSEVSYQGASAPLTRNELRILGALMRAKGGVVSRADLMYELWQSDEFVDDNTLTVNVNRLRKSLASIGVPDGFLTTHRGQGYSL